MRNLVLEKLLFEKAFKQIHAFRLKRQYTVAIRLKRDKTITKIDED